MKNWIITLIIIFILTMIYFGNKKEGIVSLSELQNSGKVNDIDGLRDFLEKCWAITYINPNGIENDIKNTTCYQAYVLGSIIPAVIGNIPNQSMKEIWATYSQDAFSNSVPQPQPIPVPIIATNTDYIMLLQLCSYADALNCIIKTNPPIWSQSKGNNGKTVTTDLCNNSDTQSLAISVLATSLLDKIKESLNHFHDQLKNSRTLNNGGDTSGTNKMPIPTVSGLKMPIPTVSGLKMPIPKQNGLKMPILKRNGRKSHFK